MGVCQAQCTNSYMLGMVVDKVLHLEIPALRADYDLKANLAWHDLISKEPR